MSLKNKIEEDFKVAIRARDSKKVSCLRLVKAAIKNKEIDVRKELDDSQVTAVLSGLAKRHKESIELFQKGGRSDLVQQEEGELKTIEAYLPKALSEAEILTLVEGTIQEVKGEGPQDVGKVMKALMPKVAGRADGKVVNALVLKKLST